MLSSFYKISVKWAVAAIALTLLAGCSGQGSLTESSPVPSSQETATSPDSTSSQAPETNSASPSDAPTPTVDLNAVVYENTQYGFSFKLTQDWQGYSIISSQWEGLPLGEATGSQSAVTGPMLSIRDPKWTDLKPRQDIPIMVFTLDQWDALQRDEFHIGAAPIGPKELGRNNKYVFALPARYNFAFLEGYKDVESILDGNPLQATQVN